MSVGPSKIFHGAKAIVQIDNKIVGIFTSCTYSINYAMHVAHVLGRHSPAAMTYTAQEAVNMSLTGFKVVDAGPWKLNTAPQLSELMGYAGVNLQLVDRESGRTLFRVTDFFATSISSGVNARSISDVTVSGVASVMHDETVEDNAEAPNATKLDDGT
jgi:hypothetical protein